MQRAEFQKLELLCGILQGSFPLLIGVDLKNNYTNLIGRVLKIGQIIHSRSAGSDPHIGLRITQALTE